ncbi:MAG TPA: uracil-DNA glycosylase [Gemmatimonadales bacterium]|nr:uracil-DNA glycosylase [Gemmatimonadales bacterium]
MSDGRALARAFLEQQRLLGGDPVILSGPPAPGVSVPPSSPGSAGRGVPPVDGAAARSARGEPREPPRAARAPTPATIPPAPATSPTSARSAVPDVAPAPSAGIAYEPPGGDLFATDPVHQAGSLDAVAALVRGCTKCRLCEGRRQAVPGEGPADARLVVVGEGPGRVEDETGRPFVGQAGDLLTKILAAIDLPRERVFICNVVKCRPPENRVPQYDEVAACLPYLFRQIELVAPAVILAMGGTAAQAVLNTKQSLGALRQQVHRFRGIPVVVTYHPAALLRNPHWKKPTWDDVRFARRLLG